jgi:hypothetical protein
LKRFRPNTRPSLSWRTSAVQMDSVRRILARAGVWLSPGGSLIVEVGAGREALEAARPDLDFLWLDTEMSRGEVFALGAKDLTRKRDAVSGPLILSASAIVRGRLWSQTGVSCAGPRCFAEPKPTSAPGALPSAVLTPHGDLRVQLRRRTICRTSAA